jgi:flagellar basal-body rod protein FlgB
MIFEGLLNRGALPVLQQVMSFTEARHEVLANNISNLDTVGYKMKDLPTDEFFRTLDDAVRRRDAAGAGARLEMRAGRHLRWDRNGRLQAKPAELKNSNILFHDENNRSVEKQMSAMAQNALLHNMTAELLRGKYGLLKAAISGKS